MRYTFIGSLRFSLHFRYEDVVVQDNFKFGDDKEIVRTSFSHDRQLCLTLISPDRCTAKQRPRH